MVGEMTMKKKKVLFMVISMNVGGTEKALLNMITMMPKKEYDITILMLEKKGGFIKSIPEWVEIKTLDEYKKMKEILNEPPSRVIMGLLQKRKLLTVFIMLILYFLTHLTKERSILFEYLLRDIRLKEEYDVAVAYAGPMDFISFFIANKINAKKKIQWIHFDISKIGFNRYFAMKVYKEFDEILAVTKEGEVKLCEMLPQFKNKINTFINIVPEEQVRNLAKIGPGFEDRFSGIRILTVGRLSLEKGQDLAIKVLSTLKKEGLNVRWYCVGEGKARTEYEQLIKTYRVEQDFILLGANPNPYNFMNQCDIYIQPSRHEGFCITLAEARCFNKPIICTKFTGAKEQIKNKETGIIVSFDEDHLYLAIKNFIEDKILWRRIISNLNCDPFTREGELQITKVFN